MSCEHNACRQIICSPPAQIHYPAGGLFIQFNYIVKRGLLCGSIKEAVHYTFFSLLKHMNQSRQYLSSSLLSMRSLAVPQEPAVGMMTS